MKIKLQLTGFLLLLSSVILSQASSPCSYGTLSYTQSGSGGSTVTLTANASGYFSPSYRWFHNATIVGTGSTYTHTVSSTGSNYVCLEVTDIRTFFDSLTGSSWNDTCTTTYCDTVSTSSGGSGGSGSGSLPPCSHGTLTYSQSGTSSPVTLTANAVGFSSPSYRWYVGSFNLGSSSSYVYSISSTSSNYVCLEVTDFYYDSATGSWDTCIATFCDTVGMSTGGSGPCRLVVNAASSDTVCVSPGATTIALGGSPTASGGVPPYVYSWSSTGASFSNSAIANPIATPFSRYVTVILTVTDSDSLTPCIKKDTIVIDTMCSRITSLLENNPLISLEAYPNPTHNVLTLKLNAVVDKAYQVEIFDISGRKMNQYTMANSIQNIDVSQLPRGTYLISIKDFNDNSSLAKPIQFIKL